MHNLVLNIVGRANGNNVADRGSSTYALPMKWNKTKDVWRWRFAVFPICYRQHDTYPTKHWIWLEWYQINRHSPPFFDDAFLRTKEEALKADKS